MAIPPEPIEEMMPLATLVIEAEVVEVLSTADRIDQHSPWADVPAVPDQLARMRVLRTLRGTPPAPELVVRKPSAPYALRQGSVRLWLLDERHRPPQILGRYGPDSWRPDEVLAAVGTGAGTP